MNPIRLAQSAALALAVAGGPAGSASAGSAGSVRATQPCVATKLDSAVASRQSQAVSVAKRSSLATAKASTSVTHDTEFEHWANLAYGNKATPARVTISLHMTLSGTAAHGAALGTVFATAGRACNSTFRLTGNFTCSGDTCSVRGRLAPTRGACAKAGCSVLTATVGLSTRTVVSRIDRLELKATGNEVAIETLE